MPLRLRRGGSATIDANVSPETKSIRVLAVIPGDGCGAAFDFARRQVASLPKLGLDIGSFFLLSRTSPLAVLGEWLRLRRNIRHFRPDLVHAHYGTVTAFVCAVSSRTPLVITFRGSDLHGDPDYSRLRSYVAQLLSQISALKASKIICVSRGLRNKLWWNRDRAVVIPTGVNLQVFRPQPKEQARALLGWGLNTPIVLFNGKYQPRVKGSEFVQAAVRVAEQSVGPIQLVSLDVPFELMPSCLNAADCLAVASLKEGSPNIVKEALACNLPIVSTDVGDVAERLKGVHPSRVVRRDVNEFAKALVDILAEGRASNGRDRIHTCDEAEVAEAIRSVYEDAVSSS